MADAALETLLAELEAHGAAHDATLCARDAKLLNITRDTGEFLDVMVRSAGARRILEVGTSNGYSALWLGRATRSLAGRVTTVECSPQKVVLAAANVARACLQDTISLVEADAGDVLAACEDGSVDLVFLDADRGSYETWWPNMRRALRRGGLLIVDNAVSHANELLDFVALVRADPQFQTSLVPVGKGEFLAVKS